MKCLNKILFLIVILIANYSFGQVSEKLNINKKSILKGFKSTIDQDKQNGISIPSNPWSTEKEKYTQLDTIIFVNRSNRANKNYCNVINWTFYRKDKFVRSYGEYCDEPTVEKVVNENDFFDLKITEISGRTYLELFNKEKLIEKFLIISLEKTQSLSHKNLIEYTLKLKRENNVPVTNIGLAN